VTLSLYYDGQLINQHGFVVFFLKFESIDLTKVPGERMYHNDGLFVPENPWDPSTDVLELEANVSADDLLRVRVRGWFVGDDLSIREMDYCDVNGNGIVDMADYVLPAGRWVLPDDWEYLAGPQWEEFRPHWDIMNNPSIPDIVTYDPTWQNNVPGVVPGTVLGTDPLGPYGYITRWTVTGLPVYQQVAGAGVPFTAQPWWPVIGPYNTLDDGLPDGRPLPPTSLTYLNPYAIARDTIIPNNQLNWWDCPMPPAKITFEITSGPGFFKAVDKADVYYQIVDAADIWPSVARGTFYVIQFTNPFYAIEIPANSEIPPFANNGGYDWDSWGWTNWTLNATGPYFFWDIINWLPNPYTPNEDDVHPTKVQVYSDNHGEAMVWLNGDWNLNLSAWEAGKGFFDIPYMEWVGNTTLLAKADYPYMRKHPVIVSNTVTNSWVWGKEIMLLVEQLKGSNQLPDITEKKVWALVSDRDHFPAIGEAIQWICSDPGYIEMFSEPGRQGIIVPGEELLGWSNIDDQHVTTWTYFPSADEQEYIGNLFGIPFDPEHPEDYPYGIAWIVVHCSVPTGVDLTVNLDERLRLWDNTEGEGMIVRQAVSVNTLYPNELDFSQSNQDPCDPVEDLFAGWNLVTFKAGTQSVAAAIASIDEYVVSVWAFNNADKSWKANNPDAPAWANDLTSMGNGQAYWIEVSADCTWAYS
jgi:hypothetical protein